MLKRKLLGRTLAVGLGAVLVCSPVVPALGAPARPGGQPAGGQPAGDPPTAGSQPTAPRGLTARPPTGKDAGPVHTLDARTRELMRRQAALLPVADALVKAKSAAGSDIAGVSIDVAKGTVNLYRQRTAAALPQGLTVPKGVRVTVHAARYNAADLAERTSRLKRDAKVLADKGVRVAAISPRVDGSGLDVTVLSTKTGGLNSPRALGPDVARAFLQDRYDGAIAAVRTTTRAWTPASQYYSGWRFNDYSPWYGGDRIAEGCTTGFPVLHNGAMKMMTAAHCGGPGRVLHNGPNTSNGTTTMGAVSYWNDSTDISVIDVASSTNSINVGPAQNSSIRAVAGWSSPVVGQYLCQSGSYTGETCGLQVVDSAQSQCISWFLWWCTKYQGPMADVISAYGSGSYAAGHGDSGAPLYWYDGSGYVHAVGQVHGQLFPNAAAAYPAYYPDTMWCPAPEGWQQRCSSGFSFAHMPGM